MEEGGGAMRSVHQGVGRVRVCAMEGNGGCLKWVRLSGGGERTKVPTTRPPCVVCAECGRYGVAYGKYVV